MSKLGCHVILSSPAALAWAKVAPIVKSIDNVAALRAAPSNAIRVFRHYVASEDLTSPAATVNGVLGALAGYNHPNLYLQLWCGAHPSRSVLSQAVALCHNLGFKTIGSSWFTGDYTQQDWDDATAAGVDAYGPQSYWGNQGFTIWHALRFAQFWKPGQKPVVVAECGRDAVEGGQAGWQKSGLTPTQYIAELVAYDVALARYPCVLGATVFSAGPTPDWLPFSTDPLSAALIIALGDAPMPLTIGAGLQKAANLIGPFIEDEVYDLPGTNAEVSRTATPKGWASWTKFSNETVVYVAATGQIWRDGGDHGNGTLRLASASFLA